MNVLLLNREEELVQVLKEKHFATDPVFTDEINRKDTLEFDLLSGVIIEKGYHVLFFDKDEETWREYIVVAPDEQRSLNGMSRHVYCESSFYELIGDWIDDRRIRQGDARNALSVALETTRWEVGAVDELGRADVSFYRTDAKTAVETIADVFEAEIKTRIEVIGNKITGRFIDLYKHRGVNQGKRFTYTKDIEEITREVSEEPIITALHGFGKGEEIGDGHGRRITFADINNGKTYLENDEARKLFGRNDKEKGKAHVFGSVKFDDIEDPKELKKETQKVLDEVSQPSITYTLKVQDLFAFGFEHELTRLGDYVIVVDKSFNPEIRIKARVVARKQYLFNKAQNELTIGNIRETYSASQQNNAIALENIRDQIGVLDGIFNGTIGLPSADGTSTIWSGTDIPSNPHNGDIWFKKEGEKVSIYEYVDGDWILQILSNDYVEKLIDGLREQVDKYDQKIEDVKNQQNAKIEAFENKVNSDLSGIRSDFNISLDQIEQRVFNNESNYSSIVQRVNGIQSEVFDSLGNSKITQLSTLIEQKVSQADVMSIVRQDANSIWQAVTDKSGKVLSEINQYDGSVRIKGDLIHLSGKSLIDDAVIKSSHIQSLTADKINTGTLNAANVNIINLNANEIVGLNSTFVRTLWNSISGGNIEITGNALKTKSSIGYHAELSGGRFEFWSNWGNKIGMMGTQRIVGEDEYKRLSIGLETRSGFSVSKKTSENSDVYTPIFYIDHGGRVVYFDEVVGLRKGFISHQESTFYSTIDTRSRILFKDDRASEQGRVGKFSTLEDGMFVSSPYAVSIGTNPAGGTNITTRAEFLPGVIRFHRALNMNNYSIINQSDARLKKDIHELTFSPLGIVEQLKGKEYEWISSDAPKGVQFGLIAQEVQQIDPDLVTSDNNYLAINQTRLNMLTTLAVKELSKRTKGEIRQLKERLSKLEGKIYGINE